MMVGEDTIEEDKQWLELRKHVALQEGKHSHQYMHKMYWEINVEKRTREGKRKELVDQTEELIRLAHHAHYHQHDEYPRMLENLATLANAQGVHGDEKEERKKGVEALVKIGEEIIRIHPYNPFTSINRYVIMMCELAELDAGVEVVGELLALVELMPKEQL